MSDRFTHWVSTADAVRATPKKLEKMAVLKAYLGRLEDADLVVAARLFAGAPFPIGTPAPEIELAILVVMAVFSTGLARWMLAVMERRARRDGRLTIRWQ